MAGLEKRPVPVLADVVSGQIGIQPAAPELLLRFLQI
jgi:hypothetical protein